MERRSYCRSGSSAGQVNSTEQYKGMPLEPISVKTGEFGVNAVSQGGLNANGPTSRALHQRASLQVVGDWGPPDNQGLVQDPDGRGGF